MNNKSKRFGKRVFIFILVIQVLYFMYPADGYCWILENTIVTIGLNVTDPKLTEANNIKVLNDKYRLGLNLGIGYMYMRIKFHKKTFNWG